ncbi:hypothetical protein RJ55_04183 [Drechmeria coniospora]|nr:hypothetical protein RJ55_04183 [Drechmeria coniospora]
MPHSVRAPAVSGVSQSTKPFPPFPSCPSARRDGAAKPRPTETVPRRSDGGRGRICRREMKRRKVPKASTF